MEYPKGINTKTVNFDNGGQIIKLGINVEKIRENQLNGEWLNIDIKKSKEKNEWYAVLNEYKKG